jgi:hypothetical protein
MRKSWLKRVNRNVLKKKTPILGFTVIQLLVMSVVISGSVAAVAINRHQSQVAVQDTVISPVVEKTEPKATTPAPITTEQNTSQPTPAPSTTPKEKTISNADRCLKLHNEQLSDDIDNFQRDIEFMRKNLASVEVNADLLSDEENNALRNKYIKFYNDSRTGSVGVYRQTMINNGCSSYIKEPNPGYVDYY